MTMNRRGGDLSLEKSRILSAYETSWRNWRAFIAEQKDQLQRQQGDAGSFTDPLGMPLASSREPVKANLPGDVRQELMRVLELRRQETQAAAEEAARQRSDAPPDRDTVFAQVLDHIDRELAGDVHPAGRALVWHEGRLHEFNHRRVLGQTSDADYATHMGDDPARKRRTLVIVGISTAIIVLVFVLLVLTNLDNESSTTIPAVREAQVAGEAVPLWDVTELNIGGRAFEVSFARTGYPLLLCAHQASQEAIVPEATLVLTGTASVRTYELVAQSATSYDLLVANCGESPPATLGKGQLMRAATSTMLDSALLSSVAVIGADMDPITIPADRMQVAITLHAAAGNDGTLILADGSRVAPSKVTPATDDTVTLMYLVPLTTSPQPAGWEVNRPGKLPAILPLTLPAPQRREELLREALAVTDETAQLRQGDSSAEIHLTLKLTNMSDQPLILRATDLTVMQNRTVALPCTWEAPHLAPHQAVTLSAVCSVTLQDTTIDSYLLEAHLATWRARLHYLP